MNYYHPISDVTRIGCHHQQYKGPYLIKNSGSDSIRGQFDFPAFLLPLLSVLSVELLDRERKKKLSYHQVNDICIELQL